MSKAYYYPPKTFFGSIDLSDSIFRFAQVFKIALSGSFVKQHNIKMSGSRVYYMILERVKTKSPFIATCIKT